MAKGGSESAVEGGYSKPLWLRVTDRWLMSTLVAIVLAVAACLVAVYLDVLWGAFFVSGGALGVLYALSRHWHKRHPPPLPLPPETPESVAEKLGWFMRTRGR